MGDFQSKSNERERQRQSVVHVTVSDVITNSS